MNNKKPQRGLIFFVFTIFVVTTMFGSFGYALTLASAGSREHILAVPNLADAFTASRHKKIIIGAPILASTVTSSPSSDTMQATTTDADQTALLTEAALSDAVWSDTDGANDAAQQPQDDPMEGLNRAIFNFNDKLDVYFLKPVATLYDKIIPKPLNQGISNFFFNINTLPTIANDLLQAHFYQAANDMWRVGINTTIGIGGFFDIAERMKLQRYSNDFGLTLTQWGWANSTYFVIPFWGASTIRDAASMPVDYFVFSIYPYIHPQSTRYELYALGVVDRRAQLLKFQGVLEEAALDKYVFVRSAYLQRRAYQIEQNKHRSCCDQRCANSNPAPVSDKNYD